MLDNILNSVKRGAERVQRRGEEVAQVARLKMEVFQLTRELDGHYARLGRAYHAGADLDLLQGIRQDIGRTEEDIAGRERLIAELSDLEGEASAGAGAQGVNHTETYTAKPKIRLEMNSEMGSAAPAAATDSPSIPNSLADNRPNFADPVQPKPVQPEPGEPKPNQPKPGQ